MFTEEYLNQLSGGDSLLALNKVINDVIDYQEQNSFQNNDVDLDIYLEGYAISQALLTNVRDMNVDEVNLEESEDYLNELFYDYFAELKVLISEKVLALKASDLKGKHMARFGNQFTYELSDGDIKEIQRLINELRGAISDSDLFEDGHKSRLLAKLEKMQSEIHKKMSDFDKYWGLFAETGVAIGKFGEDAKPFVDRVTEITKVIWGSQARAEELASDTPLLMIRDNNKEDDN